VSALDAWCETHGGSESARYEFNEVVRRAKGVYGGRVLEVGTYRGDSLRIWIEAFAPQLAVGVEKEYTARIVDGLDDLLLLPDVSIVFGDSTNAMTWQEVKRRIAEVDFLYIDGDHTFPATLIDYALYGSLVRPGGWIVFDDIRNENGVTEVTRFLDGEVIYGGGDSTGKFIIEKGRE
jgi:predicted O-methyltransferase YrrM